MTASTSDLIKKFEGCRLEAYQDVGGVWTIGYGHTGPEVRAGMKITQQAADDLLWEDMRWVAQEIERTVKVRLTAGQEAAISSLIYNIGGSAWRKSTALKRLNAGDYAGAADAMTWWNKAGGNVVMGLVRRRETERELFLSDVAGEEVEAQTGSIGGGEAKSIAQSKTIWGALAGSGGLAAAFVQALGTIDWRVAIALVVVAGAFGFLIFNRIMEARAGVK